MLPLRVGRSTCRAIQIGCIACESRSLNIAMPVLGIDTSACVQLQKIATEN